MDVTWCFLFQSITEKQPLTLLCLSKNVVRSLSIRGTEVYEGMIIGENSRENDLTVNITKAKQMTNVRSATKDQTAVIKTPRILTLEESLEFLNDDEYMEVTPESIRLRKQILNKAEREKANKKEKISSC